MPALVSIIIPIYNVASYIEQCIESVINQTYTDIEVLLVDDCGTDNSMDIANRIINEYEGPITFQIIHHDHNRGLSAARNSGIEVSHGEWLYFLDSDDWITNNCIEKMVDSLATYPNSDMVIGNYSATDSINTPPLELETGIYQTNLLGSFLHYQYYMMAWNKLVNRKFIISNDLLFKDGIIHEDDLWSFCCACKMKCLNVINEKTYVYRIRANGIEQSADFNKHYNGYYEAITGMLDYVLSHHERQNKDAAHFIIRQLHNLFIAPLYNNQAELNYQFYKSLSKKNFWNLLEIKGFTRRKLFLMFYFRRIFSIKIIYPIFLKYYRKKYDKGYNWFITYYI